MAFGADADRNVPEERGPVSSTHDFSGQSEQSGLEQDLDSLHMKSLEAFAYRARFGLSRRDDAEGERVFEALSQDCLALLRKVYLFRVL